MKIQINVERSIGSIESTEKIIEDIVSMVEELSERHPNIIIKKMVEVTITEKR